MGCLSSKESVPERPGKSKSSKDDGLKRPTWASDTDLDSRSLQRRREEFWDTQPAYGGAKEVWDALKAVAEDLDNPNNKLILESAGITYHHNDIRTAYDEKGFRYELPNYVLSDPSNLKATTSASDSESARAHSINSGSHLSRGASGEAASQPAVSTTTTS